MTTCPDDGTCHHECKDTTCFRVRCCGPLSGVYVGDQWPEFIRKATDPENFYARQLANYSHVQLVAEVIRLHKGYGTELAETEEHICKALGLESDPEYGYPTGDHITATLAATLAEHIAKLRRYCGVVLDHRNYKLPCMNAWSSPTYCTSSTGG